MIRVSISGSHSVGKTTLAKPIVDYFSAKYTVEEIKEVARYLIKKGFKMSQDITEYGVVHYIHEYLRQERRFAGDILISDRSLIDLLAYISVNESRKIRTTFLSLVEEIVYLESNFFDLYLYIPVEIPLAEDGVRPVDLRYRNLVDEKIQEILVTYDLPWIKVSGSIDERKNIVVKAIEGIIKKKY